MEKEISLPIKVIEEDAATLGYVFNSIKEIDKNNVDFSEWVIHITKPPV